MHPVRGEAISLEDPPSAERHGERLTVPGRAELPKWEAAQTRVGLVLQVNPGPGRSGLYLPLSSFPRLCSFVLFS